MITIPETTTSSDIRMSREDEYEWSRRWTENNDPTALDALVKAHLRLVRVVARKYTFTGMDYDELVALGNEGLVRAVQQFDPEHGTRLTTYAVWWIRAVILRAYVRTFSPVRIGSTPDSRKVFYHLRRARALLEAAGGTATAENLAVVLQVPVDVVEVLLPRFTGGDVPLDAVYDEDATHPKFELVSSIAHVDEQYEEAETLYARRQVLKNALKTFAPRTRNVIRLRHLVPVPWTLDKIGKHYGVSRERIRQIEEKALTQLKEQCCSPMP